MSFEFLWNRSNVIFVFTKCSNCETHITVSNYSYSVIIGLIDRIVVEVLSIAGESEYINDFSAA
jgi:hypothetical protein